MAGDYRAARLTRDARAPWRAISAIVLAMVPTLVLAAAPDAAGTPWGPIGIAGQTVAPGQQLRTFVNVSGARGGENRLLDTPVVVIRGAKPGPTLCVTAGIHGDELNGVEIARRVYAGVTGAELAGMLVVMPALNIQGLRNGSRYLPDRRDLNRAFPGNPNGSLAARIAHSLHSKVVRHCGALIDLHTGSASRTNLPQIRTDLGSPESLAMARSFGVGVVLHGRGPKGSLRREALDAGVPAVIYEAGEPLRFQEPEIARGVRGVRNVMADLGMLDEETTGAGSQVYRRTTWVRAGDASGIFLSAVGPGDQVAEGDTLGTVTDPRTDEVTTIQAPRPGRVIGMAVPQFVLPGYALFNLGFDSESLPPSGGRSRSE